MPLFYTACNLFFSHFLKAKQSCIETQQVVQLLDISAAMIMRSVLFILILLVAAAQLSFAADPNIVKIGYLRMAYVDSDARLDGMIAAVEEINNVTSSSISFSLQITTIPCDALAHTDGNKHNIRFGSDFCFDSNNNSTSVDDIDIGYVQPFLHSILNGTFSAVVFPNRYLALRIIDASKGITAPQISTVLNVSEGRFVTVLSPDTFRGEDFVSDSISSAETNPTLVHQSVVMATANPYSKITYLFNYLLSQHSGCVNGKGILAILYEGSVSTDKDQEAIIRTLATSVANRSVLLNITGRTPFQMANQVLQFSTTNTSAPLVCLFSLVRDVALKEIVAAIQSAFVDELSYTFANDIQLLTFGIDSFNSGSSNATATNVHTNATLTVSSFSATSTPPLSAPEGSSLLFPLAKDRFAKNAKIKHLNRTMSNEAFASYLETTYLLQGIIGQHAFAYQPKDPQRNFFSNSFFYRHSIDIEDFSFAKLRNGPSSTFCNSASQYLFVLNGSSAVVSSKLRSSACDNNNFLNIIPPVVVAVSETLMNVAPSTSNPSFNQILANLYSSLYLLQPSSVAPAQPITTVAYPGLETEPYFASLVTNQPSPQTLISAKTDKVQIYIQPRNEPMLLTDNISTWPVGTIPMVPALADYVHSLAAYYVSNAKLRLSKMASAATNGTSSSINSNLYNGKNFNTVITFGWVAETEAEANLITNSMASMGITTRPLNGVSSGIVSSRTAFASKIIQLVAAGFQFIMVAMADPSVELLEAVYATREAFKTNNNYTSSDVNPPITIAVATHDYAIAELLANKSNSNEQKISNINASFDIIFASASREWWISPSTVSSSSTYNANFADSIYATQLAAATLTSPPGIVVPAMTLSSGYNLLIRRSWHIMSKLADTAALQSKQTPSSEYHFLSQPSVSSLDALYHLRAISMPDGGFYGPFEQVTDNQCPQQGVALCQCFKAARTFYVHSGANAQNGELSHRTNRYQFNGISGTCGVDYAATAAAYATTVRHLYPLKDSNGNTVGMIVGVVVGGATVVLVVLLVLVFLTRNYFVSQSGRDNTNAPKDPQAPFAMIFTDVQSSTALWARAPTTMSSAIEQHHEIIRGAIQRTGGYEVKTVGDSFMVAFHEAEAAVRFALDVQLSLVSAEWGPEIDQTYFEIEQEEAEGDESQTQSVSGEDYGLQFGATGQRKIISAPFHGIRVRVGVHFGFGDIRKDPVSQGYDYYGTVVNTAARVEGVGHGGQILITEPVYTEITNYDPMFSLTNDASITLLGSYPLRGLDDPVQLYQIQPRAACRTYPALRLHVENTVEESESDTNATYPTGTTGTSNNNIFAFTRKGSTAVGSHTTSPSVYQSTQLNQSDRYSATGTHNSAQRTQAEILVLNYLRKDRSGSEQRRHEPRVSINDAFQDNQLNKAELLFAYTFLQSILATTPTSFQSSALKQFVESWGLSKSDLKASKTDERRRNKLYVELAARVTRVCKVKSFGLKLKQSLAQSLQESISIASSYPSGQSGVQSQKTQLGVAGLIPAQLSTLGFSGNVQVSTEMTPTNLRSSHISFSSRAQSVQIE